jgi:hypothetical protein
MPRLGWPEPGEWHLISNDVAPVSKYKQRRAANTGITHVDHYRWVVVEPPMLVRVWASPRTTQPGYVGHDHQPHPMKHESTCKIDEIGTVCTPPTELDQPVFRGATYSCVEPDDTWPDVLEACAIPRPRRPDQRRRRRR